MKIPTQIKLTLVSGTNAGQSAIIQRFCRDVFIADLPSTATSTFTSTKAAIVDQTRVGLSIWTTPGHKAYAQFAEMGMIGADCIVFVFSIENNAQFEEIVSRARESLRRNKAQRGILVGAKADKQRVVSAELAKKAAESLSMPYVECSALSGEGIEAVFQAAVAESLKTRGITAEQEIRFE